MRTLAESDLDVHEKRPLLSRLTSLAIDSSALTIALFLFSYMLHQIHMSTLPSPLHGEWWGIHSFSDFLSLLGGRHFHEEGFMKNYFTMNDTVGFRELARGWQYYQVPQLVQNSAIYYTHYGSLDAIVVGLLMHLGITRLSDFYVIFSFLSILSLGLWYITTSLLFGRPVGLVSMIVMGTSVLFLRMAVAVNAEPLSLQLAILAIFAFVVAQRVCRARTWRWTAYGVAWIAGVLEANNSPVFLPFIAIAFAGYLWLYASHTRKTFVPFLVAASGLIFGYLVHQALSAWVLGGIRNLVADLGAAFHRRTIGFNEELMAGWKHFPLLHSPRYIEGQMWDFMHLGFLGIIGLVLLSGWVIQLLSERDREDLIRQWWMVIILLLGGGVFVFAFVEASVTEPMDILKAMLPGIGPLVGLVIVALIRYLWTNGQTGWTKLGAVLIGIYILGPYVRMVESGTPFRSDFYAPSDAYIGASPEEVRALATFLKEHTQHGDIILTNVNTGETGHLHYPHPAWEYLSDRRIEMFDTSIERASIYLGELAKMRDSLVASNRARHVDFYVLLSSWFAKSDLGRVARLAGDETARFESHRWWMDRVGFDPFPDRRRAYGLFHVDPLKWRIYAELVRTHSSTAAPNSNTPWTRVSRMDVLPSEDGWSMGISRFARLLGGGTLLFTSRESKAIYPGLNNMSISEPRFDGGKGSTLEVRMRVIDPANEDQNGAMLALQDGRREAKIGFFGTHIDLFDQNESRAVYPSSPDRSFHVYRLTVVGDVGRLYVDGDLAAFGRLKNKVSERGVLFGDYSRKVSEGFTAELNYIAYSAQGAFAPGGTRLVAGP